MSHIDSRQDTAFPLLQHKCSDVVQTGSVACSYYVNAAVNCCQLTAADTSEAALDSVQECWVVD